MDLFALVASPTCWQSFYNSDSRVSIAVKPVTIHLSRFLVFALTFSLLALTTCNVGNIDFSRKIDQSQFVAESDWKAAVKEELGDRSFRRFQPSKDGNPRKVVILDFSNGIGLWAQYSEDGYAINKWEIQADSYSIDGQSWKHDFHNIL